MSRGSADGGTDDVPWEEAWAQAIVARRRDVVHRLLDTGISPNLIAALIPEWEVLIHAVRDEREAADTPDDQPVRFVIIDDEPTLRRLVAAVADTEPGIELVGEAGDGEVAADLVGETRPDVVVLDVSMPRVGGIEAIGLVREVDPEVRIVMWSALADRRDEALAAGADAWVTKGAPLRELVRAVIDS